MKIRFFILIFLLIGQLNVSIARNKVINADSIITVALSKINSSHAKDHLDPITYSDFGINFHIIDIVTHVSIIDHGYGIYLCKETGDDLDYWIICYDNSGYKFYEQCFDVTMLGEILDYLNRNNYTDSQSLKYITALQKIIVCLDNCFVE